MSNQQKKNTFYGGVGILLLSTTIVKIMGALFKIPLGMLLTDPAYGDFNSAYNIYTFFLTISTAGLPVALSKMVSEAHALGRRNQVDRIFQVAFLAFFTMGLLSFLCMSLFAPVFAKYVIHNEKAVYCVMALSPAVLCTCCCSAFRGYAQGHLNMKPTATSQIIENVCKVLIGVALAFVIWKLALQPKDFGDRMVAVGAILGVSLGSILSVVYLSVQHVHTHGRRTRSTDVPDGRGGIFSNLLRLAVPITIGSAALAIVTLIDTNLVNAQLQQVFTALQSGHLPAGSGLLGITDYARQLLQDFTQAALADPAGGIDPVLDSARSLYGIYGKTMNPYNLPSAFMVPLTAAIIPAVSAARARRDRLEARRISESSLRMSALIALPAGLGLSAVAPGIMSLITLGKINTAVAGPLLTILGVASVFICFQVVCTSILQANGNVNLPIFFVIVGGVVKILVNYTLVGNPQVMIFGAPVGTLCCFAIIVLLDLIAIKRVVPNAPSYSKAFVKPLLAAAAMAVCARAVYGLLSGRMGSERLTAILVSTLGAVGVGAVVYLALVLALRVISKEDLALMPKGDKIAKFLHIQ